MGYQTAYELANRPDLGLRQSVITHLLYNFVPSQGLWFHVALRVIEKVRKSGHLDHRVRLPQGVRTTKGKRTAQAGMVIEHLRLWPWVEGYLHE